MTHKSPVTSVALLLLSAVSLFAQTSPEILPDGRVTFRCRAPKADEVKAEGQFGPTVILHRDDQGLWEGTTPEPLQPGIFEYHLQIDGLNTIDARNAMIKPQRWPGSSILHIPATPPAPWDLQKIPHGTMHRHDYFSDSLGKWRTLAVYTPPEQFMTGPLPVFYLAHGYSDNQDSWSVHGKAHWIMDALIHSGKARCMIVVMPDAHAIDPPDVKHFDSYGPKNTAAFCDDLIKDVIPFIEKNYNVQKDADGRAFAGLSMGGGHALQIALRHSDLFSQVGAFSSATPKGDLIENAGKEADRLNRNLRVFWVGCGDKDFLFERNQEMHAQFEQSGIKHIYHVTKGDGHAWPVWRQYLTDFAPLLFKTGKIQTK